MNKEKENTAPTVFDFHNFNFSRLEYSYPTRTRGGAHASSIYYRLNRNTVVPVFIRTPKVKTSSGICRSGNRYHIEFDLDTNNEHSNFYDFLTKCDENSKKISYQNSTEWFEEPFPMDIIDDYYQGTIRLNSGGKSPTVKVRIPSKGDIIIPQIYNNGSVVDHSYISPDDTVEAVIVLDELKFYEQKFHAEWLLVQLKVYKKKLRSVEIPSSYLLKGEDDEEHVPIKLTKAPVEEPTTQESTTQESTTQEPTTQDLTTQEPVAQELATPDNHESTNQKPVDEAGAAASSEEQVSEEQASEEQVSEEQSSEEQPSEKQVMSEKVVESSESNSDQSEVEKIVTEKMVAENAQPQETETEDLEKESVMKEDLAPEDSPVDSQKETELTGLDKDGSSQEMEDQNQPKKSEKKPEPSRKEKYYVLDPVWGDRLTVDDMEEVPIFNSGNKKVDPAILEKFTNTQKLLEEAYNATEKSRVDAIEREEKLKHEREEDSQKHLTKLKHLEKDYLELKQQLGLEQ